MEEAPGTPSDHGDSTIPLGTAVPGGSIAHSKKRKGKSTRWNIPQHALAMLEQVFLKDKFPTVNTRKALAADLRVTPRQVQVWFQNKRQRSTKTAEKCDASSGRILNTSVCIVPDSFAFAYASDAPSAPYLF